MTMIVSGDAFATIDIISYFIGVLDTLDLSNLNNPVFTVSIDNGFHTGDADVGYRTAGYFE